MRILVAAALAICPVLGTACSPAGGAGRASPAPAVPDAGAGTGLVLQPHEGERRVRRPRPDNAGGLAAAAMIIKVDQRNGGSVNFFMGVEDIQPGDAVPPHRHPGYDEILFVHRGRGLATLGTRQAAVTAGTTIYIPADTRVSLRNTGDEPLSIVFVFPRPDVISAYYRELTVPDGVPAAPFSPAEFAAFRARHRAHVQFEQP